MCEIRQPCAFFRGSTLHTMCIGTLFSLSRGGRRVTVYKYACEKLASRGRFRVCIVRVWVCPGHGSTYPDTALVCVRVFRVLGCASPTDERPKPTSARRAMKSGEARSKNLCSSPLAPLGQACYDQAAPMQTRRISRAPRVPRKSVLTKTSKWMRVRLCLATEAICACLFC